MHNQHLPESTSIGKTPHPKGCCVELGNWLIKVQLGSTNSKGLPVLFQGSHQVFFSNKHQLLCRHPVAHPNVLQVVVSRCGSSPMESSPINESMEAILPSPSCYHQPPIQANHNARPSHRSVPRRTSVTWLHKPINRFEHQSELPLVKIGHHNSNSELGLATERPPVS